MASKSATTTVLLLLSLGLMVLSQSCPSERMQLGWAGCNIDFMNCDSAVGFVFQECLEKYCADYDYNYETNSYDCARYAYRSINESSCITSCCGSQLARQTIYFAFTYDLLAECKQIDDQILKLAGIIAGAVVGGVVGLVLLCFLVIYIRKKGCNESKDDIIECCEEKLCCCYGPCCRKCKTTFCCCLLNDYDPDYDEDNCCNKCAKCLCCCCGERPETYQPNARSGSNENATTLVTNQQISNTGVMDSQHNGGYPQYYNANNYNGIGLAVNGQFNPGYVQWFDNGAPKIHSGVKCQMCYDDAPNVVMGCGHCYHFHCLAHQVNMNFTCRICLARLEGQMDIVCWKCTTKFKALTFVPHFTTQQSICDQMGTFECEQCFYQP